MPLSNYIIGAHSASEQAQRLLREDMAQRIGDVIERNVIRTRTQPIGDFFYWGIERGLDGAPALIITDSHGVFRFSIDRPLFAGILADLLQAYVEGHDAAWTAHVDRYRNSYGISRVDGWYPPKRPAGGAA